MPHLTIQKATRFLLGENMQVLEEIPQTKREFITKSTMISQSSMMDFVNVKVLTQGLTHNIHLCLEFYCLEMNQTLPKKIQKIDLGVFEPNSGKVLTRKIGFTTPKTGSFLVTFLEITPLQGGLVDGSLFLDFSVDMIQKKNGDEKTIELEKISDRISF